MIEMGKQYRTRDGREVRIYAVDAGGSYSVHGAIKSREDGKWWHHAWQSDGKFGGNGVGSGHPCDKRADLIEVKPKHLRTYWLVHGHVNARAFQSEGHARNQAGPALAITGPHAVEFTEGDGLDHT